MKATRNNFMKGLKNEKDPLSVTNDEYVDALNIRIESDEGGSSYSVINIKGNRHDTTIPDVPSMVVITPDFDEIEAATLPISAVPSITINGNIVSGAPVYANDRSALVLFRNLQNAFETDPVFAPYDLKVARQGLRIVVTSQTNTVTSALGSREVVCADIAGMTGESQFIIGWAHSDVSFYILTTNNTTATGGHGAVWKLTYDGVDFTYTWDIRYSSPDLMFTTQHPVANPSGIEVSDETDEIVRLAWTDDHNPLRFLNVESPNSLALTVGMLNVEDGQTNTLPIFKDVLSGGVLKNGSYQIAYRLRADDAAYSLISQHSNVINLVEDAEHSEVTLTGYEGSDSDENALSGKALKFIFNIPETAYDFLEIFTLYRSSRTAVPEVRLVSEIPIYSNSIEYLISGAEEQASFTFEEFQNLYNPFTHCKTIAQKDSILFAGNVRSDAFDVDFDARAYGHNKAGQSYITTPQELYPSDQTLDAINPDFNEYRYQANGTTYGGEGLNVKYSFVKRFHFGDTVEYTPDGEYIGPKNLFNSQRFISAWSSINNTDNVTLSTDPSGGQDSYEGMMRSHMSPWEAANYRGYKAGEIYRFSFVPVKNGEEGRAKWIADIKIPHYSDEPDDTVNFWWDNYKVVNRNPNDHTPAISPVGIKFEIDVSSIANDIDYYKIKRVKRTDADKTILATGIIGITAQRNVSDLPGHYLDANTDIENGAGLGKLVPYQSSDSRPRAYIEGNAAGIDTSLGAPEVYSFYSPDICFRDSFDSRGGDQLRIHSLLHPTIELSKQNGIDSYTLNATACNTQVTKLYGQINIRDNFPVLSGGRGFYTIDVKDAGICEYGASFEFDNGKIFHNRSWAAENFGSSNVVGPLQDQLGAKCLAVSGVQRTPYMIGLQQFSVPNHASSNSVDTRLCSSLQFQPGSITIGLGGEPNTIDIGQQGTETQLRRYADYYRPLLAQYGGNTYTARSKNTYIDTGTCVKVTPDSTITEVDVFGGDTYINIFGITTLTRNAASYFEDPVLDSDDFQKIDQHSRRTFNYIEFFPVESDINTDLRQGQYFNKSAETINYLGIDLSGHNAGDPVPDLQFNWNAGDWEAFAPSNTLKIGEDFIYNTAYSNEEELQPSFPEPLAGEEVDNFPTRIYASDVKTSGEIVNSWRRFRTQSFIEINSAHGPINALVNNLDRIIALQDDAMGTASVNERQVAQTQTGEATILGNSGVLPRFDYITKHTGSRHQFGLVLSPNSLYFYDVSDGVLYRFDGQKINPISQVGELNQFFYNNFRGELLRNDNPIDPILPDYNTLGITGTYDFRFNEALFTFHGKINGEYVSRTLAYNENGNTFTSFYGFTPTVYLNDRENVFSPGPVSSRSSKRHQLYIHNKGERGVFYDNPPEASYVEIIVNAESPSSKIFTNLEWNSEVYDSSGNNTFDETVDSITISNEYQTLPALTQYQRRFRTWRATIPREAATRARLRGHYMRMRYTFNNSDDRKFVLSGVTTIYDMTAY